MDEDRVMNLDLPTSQSGGGTRGVLAAVAAVAAVGTLAVVARVAPGTHVARLGDAVDLAVDPARASVAADRLTVPAPRFHHPEYDRLYALGETDVDALPEPIRPSLGSPEDDDSPESDLGNDTRDAFVATVQYPMTSETDVPIVQDDVDADAVADEGDPGEGTEPVMPFDQMVSEDEARALDEAEDERSEDADEAASASEENSDPDADSGADSDAPVPEPIDSFEAFEEREALADAESLEAGEDPGKSAEAYIISEELRDASPMEWGEGGAHFAEVRMNDEHNDLLAVAVRDDPLTNKYLPPMYEGFDMSSDSWAHKPVESRSGKNKFNVCIYGSPDQWDKSYADGLDNLFAAGVCFDDVSTGDCEGADVVVFNEATLLWGGGYRNGAGEIEFPHKTNKNQVYLLFAHEAAGTFGWENRDGDMLRQLDYLAYFDRKQSAIWWPFGPTLRSMLRDYKFFARPRERRIPGLAWLAVDCLPLRTKMLQAIGDKFPVFSMGRCQNNAQGPEGLPARGDGGGAFQSLMAQYMFYFAVENGGECPGYSTEKVWLSLIRGSVPVYYGGKEVLEMMPTPESYVDLKKFDSPEALAARLYEIATDPKAYWEVHKWRYQDPMTWSEGFRRLIRVMSTDIKYSVCDVLQKGTSEYPKAKAQAVCNNDVKVMGRRPDGFAEMGGIPAWQNHLEQTCDEPRLDCYAFKNPDAYRRGKRDEGEGGEEPVSDGEEPVSDGEEPVSGGEEPVSGGEEPVSGGEEPVSDGEEPVSDGEEPVSGGEEPVSGGEEPVSYGEEPVSDGEGPVSGGEEPVSGGEEPVSDGEEPVSDGEEPVSGGSPSLTERSPVRRGEEPVSYGEEPVSYGEEPVSDGEEPVSYGEEPVSYGEEPVSYGEEPVSYGEEPVSYGEEPVSYGEDPLLGE